MYILSTQVLLDILTQEPHVTAWIREVSWQDISISAASVASIRETIERESDPAFRAELDADLRRIVALVGAGGRIVMFELEDAHIFATLPAGLDVMRPDGTVTYMGDLSRIVLAAALKRNLILVDLPQPYHDAIANLSVLDPYQ